MNDIGGDSGIEVVRERLSKIMPSAKKLPWLRTNAGLAFVGIFGLAIGCIATLLLLSQPPAPTEDFTALVRELARNMGYPPQTLSDQILKSLSGN